MIQSLTFEVYWFLRLRGASDGIEHGIEHSRGVRVAHWYHTEDYVGYG